MRKNEKKQEKQAEDLIEKVFKGIYKGLLSFFIIFVVALLASIFLNSHYLETVNTMIVGSLGEKTSMSPETVIKTTAALMNLMALNRIGSSQLGILIFALVPVIVFYFLRSRLEKAALLSELLVYGVAGAVYSLILAVFSYVTKGKLVGLMIDFTGIGNLIITFLLVVFIQLLIALNTMNFQEKRWFRGFRRTRVMIRLFMTASAVISIVAMLFYGLPLTDRFWLLLLFIVLVLPNVTVYLMFFMMGVPFEIGKDLKTLMDFVHLDFNYEAIPLYYRLIGIVVFVLLLTVVLVTMNQRFYYRRLLIFAFGYSLIMGVFAFLTQVNISFIKNLFDIRFGMNPLQVSLVSLVVIGLVGLMIALFRRLKSITDNNDDDWAEVAEADQDDEVWG